MLQRAGGVRLWLVFALAAGRVAPAPTTRCSLPHLGITDPLPTPLEYPVVFTTPANRNARITALMAEAEMLRRMGHEEVHLTSSNTFSEGHYVMTLQQYLAYLAAPSCAGASAAAFADQPQGDDALPLACAVRANETLYLFGENYSPSWEALAAAYVLPPCSSCVGDNVAVSLGIGGANSGVSWHTHGAGFSEVGCAGHA